MKDSVVEDAWAFVRGHSTGDLRFDEHFRPVKYVVEPGGRLVAPAMVAMLTSVDTVLFIPETAEDAGELMVTLIPFDEEGEHGFLADRWRIYHGDPEDVRWAFLDIDAMKWRDEVIDGDALARANPLASIEASLCRMVNQGDRENLRHFCQERGGVEVEDPVMVGIDPLGIDVRRRFDVIRLPASAPMTNEADARRELESILREEQGR